LTWFLDLDGPILDVSEKYYRVYSRLVQAFGGGALPKADYWELKRRKTPNRSILGMSRLPEDLEPAYMAERKNLIETPEFLKYDRIHDGAFETLQTLAAKGDSILVTLRSSREALLDELKRLSLDRFFRKILSAEGSPGGNWEKKVGLIQSHFSRIDPDSMFVGDTETDILAGKKLGLTTVAVLCGIRNREWIEKHEPSYVIDALSQIRTLIPSLEEE
jgi:phosphoglycolate phosphatase-like HAD superfamily hydrolase